MDDSTWLVEIDSLRALAAVAAMAFHYTTKYDDVLGQSNAGNHGSVARTARHGVAWVDGRCYVAKDPLPGATGALGSSWSRSLDTDPPPSYAMAILALDTSRISDWTRPGPLAERLRSLTDSLREHDVAVTAVLWQQGEADARDGTTRRDYATALAALILRVRSEGIAAPWFLAKSTRCRNAGSAEVRDALDQVARAERNVFPGPDLDRLGDDFRSDGCDLNENGLLGAAKSWQDSLARAQQYRSRTFNAEKKATMLFNSAAFIFGFFPLTVVLFFWIARRSHLAAARWLALAGLVRNGRQKAAPSLLAFAVTGNLALLGYYMYANFFLRVVRALRGWIFITLRRPAQI